MTGGVDNVPQVIHVEDVWNRMTSWLCCPSNLRDLAKSLLSCVSSDIGKNEKPPEHRIKLRSQRLQLVCLSRENHERKTAEI